MLVARLILFVTPGLMAVTVAAQESVFRDGSGRLVLTAPSCRDLKNPLQALRQWTQGLGQKAVCPDPVSLRPALDGSCQADVSACVPERVRQLQDRSAVQPGPNCYNAVLVSQGVLARLNSSNETEAQFLLASPICKNVGPAREARPGDIGVIRGPGGDEIHGFVFISDRLIYSKNGGTIQAPYAVQAKEPVETGYRNFYCRGRPGCATHTTYHRCQSMSSYLARHPDPAGFESLKAQIDRLDREMSEYHFSPRSASRDRLTAIFNEARNLEEAVVRRYSLGAVRTLGLAESFTFGRLAVRLHSLVRDGELALAGAYERNSVIPSTAEDQALMALYRRALLNLRPDLASNPSPSSGSVSAFTFGDDPAAGRDFSGGGG